MGGILPPILFYPNASLFPLRFRYKCEVEAL